MKKKEFKAKVLIIDDEQPIREVLAASLQDEDYLVEVASNGEEGIEKILKFQPDVTLLDVWMPGKLDGIDVLREANNKNLDCNFIVMSGHANIETAVKATKLGAWDFIEKPLSMDKISIQLSNLLSYQKEKKQKVALLNRLRQNFSLIGTSNKMVSLKESVAKISQKVNALFIVGEKGVGKQLIAQHIHYFSHRASFLFTEINVTSVPQELIEAELFGFIPGTFTGNFSEKLGKIELAQEGSLLIKGIDHLSLDLQKKLAQVIREQKLQKIGHDQETSIQVRFILSATEDPKSLLEQNKLAPELYQLIESNVFFIAPLREKKEDVHSLIEHFARQFEKEGAYDHKELSSEALSKLEDYDWPGNVRELKNFVERLYILATNKKITVDDLHYCGLHGRMDDVERMFDFNSNLREARSQFEKEFILKKLSENDGNISKTAEAIGVERSHLHRKIKSYGIDIKESL